MSDLYSLFINVLDIVTQLILAVMLCRLYHHFFRLKIGQSISPGRMARPLAGLAAFLPGAVWTGVRGIVDHFIVVGFTESADSVRGLFKQLLVTGSLLLIAFVFYQGSRRQLTLITMLFAAVTEIGRFLSFTLSSFWSRVYDLCTQWFDRNYSRIDLEDFLLLLKWMGMLQQVSYALLFIGIVCITLRYVRRSYKSRELPLHRTEFLFLMFPCASSFLLCTLLRIIMFTFTGEDAIPKTLFEMFPLLIVIVPLLLILCLFSMLYSIKLYQEMLTLNEERNRRAVLEKQVVSMEEHARERERLYSGVRAMKHDMKNQLAVLENLMGRQEDDGEIPGYLEQLNRTLGKLDVPFQTGSTVVDSLLSMKYHEICEKLPGLSFGAEDLIFPKECRIQPTDLCIILGNALDNAIEACEKPGADDGQKGRYIRLYSRYQKEMLILTVENSFDGELKLIQGSAFPSTTKPDSGAHGIGMHNIKTAAERYQGGVVWEADHNRFALTVMLDNSPRPDSFLL